MYKQFLFKGGIVDGRWISVPCDELGRPKCDYWRVAKPAKGDYHRIQEYRPCLFVEGDVEYYIFKEI